MPGAAAGTAGGGGRDGLEARPIDLAVVVRAAIYLRQRGSPESKLVGAPHSATGMEG